MGKLLWKSKEEIGSQIEMELAKRKVAIEMILKWSQKGNISHWKENEIRRGFSQRESLNWLEMK